jgi:hypothetical protein
LIAVFYSFIRSNKSGGDLSCQPEMILQVGFQLEGVSAATDLRLTVEASATGRAQSIASASQNRRFFGIAGSLLIQHDSIILRFFWL